MPADEQPATDPARDCARHIAQAFADYNAEFRAITRRAPLNFERRDWKKAQRDAVERIELYDRFVHRCIIRPARRAWRAGIRAGRMATDPPVLRVRDCCAAGSGIHQDLLQLRYSPAFRDYRCRRRHRVRRDGPRSTGGGQPYRWDKNLRQPRFAQPALRGSARRSPVSLPVEGFR
jgi:hypothetical protein